MVYLCEKQNEWFLIASRKVIVVHQIIDLRENNLRTFTSFTNKKKTPIPLKTHIVTQYIT